MKNINIEKTNNNTYVVKADTKRFGVQQIMFESAFENECLQYIEQQKQLIKKYNVLLIDGYNAKNEIINLIKNNNEIKAKIKKMYSREYALTSADVIILEEIEEYQEGYYIRFTATRSMLKIFVTRDKKHIRKPKNIKLLSRYILYDKIYDDILR